MKSSRFLAPFAGALLLAAGSSAFAGVNSWTLSGPYGGEASAVAIYPADPAMLLVSMGNGLYRSTDGGATWTYRADVYSAHALVIDPSNTQRLFALRGDGRIVRSDDGAATFTQLTDPPNFTSGGHIAVATDGTLYVADERGDLYKSANSGTTWNTLAVPWPIADNNSGAIAVDPANANIVIVGIRGVGTFRSVDGGETWTPVAIANSPGSHSASERVFDFAFKPGASARLVAASDAGIQVSSDGGASWTASNNGILALSLAFDPAQPTDVVAMGAQRIWRSTDSGDNWSAGVDLHLLSAGDLVFGTGHRLLLAGSDGPMVSDDGGGTFALRCTGILSASVRSFSRSIDGVSYANLSPGPFGLYELGPAGAQPLGNDALRANVPFYPYIWAFSVAPNNRSRFYAVGTSDAFVTSFNGGLNWTQPLAQFYFTNKYIERVFVDPTDMKVVYVTTQSDGVWRSEDSGAIFVKRSTGLPAQVSVLAIDPVNSAVIYAGDAATPGSGIYKSLDSGVTWAPLGTATLGTSLVIDIAIDPANPQIVYASLRDGLHKSTDGGASWSFVGPAGISASTIILDTQYPHTVIYGGISAGPGFTAFARSVDDGAHWQTVPSALVHPSLGSFEFVSFEHGFGKVFAGGIGTGLHEYQISTDLAAELGEVPAVVAPNSTVTFQVIVRNLGPFDAAAPTLDIRIPANATVATMPSVCQPFQDVLRCVLPGLRNGQSQTYTVDYTAAATMSNAALQANIFSREYDSVSTNNDAVATVLTHAVTDLGVTSTAPATVQTNATIAFSATVTNGGPNASDTTTYTLTAPATVTLQTPATTVGTCAVASNRVTCQLGSMASGASATITVSGTTTQAGTLSWSSAVTGSGDDPAATNNAITSSTVASNPPPPPPPPSSNGGGGGGGRFDWWSLAMLTVLLAYWRATGRGASR